MFRQRCKFHKRFGLLQVIITCFVFIFTFTFTSVVISSNPASALVCDRTTNDYSGWSKREWMGSWFNKQMYIPDNQLKNVPNSESLIVKRISRSSNGNKTKMKFQLLPGPDGKMVATLTMGGFKSIQRYKCDKGVLQLAEERTARLRKLDEEANDASGSTSTSVSSSSTSSALCNLATKLDEMGNRVWDDNPSFADTVAALKKSGEECGVISDEVVCSNLMAYPSGSLEVMFDSNVREKWAIEAERRDLGCFAEWQSNLKKEEEVKKAAELAAQKKEKEAKKAAELAAKKKEEEAKKAAELAAKKKEEEAKKAAELAAKKKELEAKIASQKERLPDLYEDVIAYVKTSSEVDVIEWTNLYSKAPREEAKWTEKESNAFDDFEVKVLADNNFKRFHDESMAKRKQEFIQSVIDTRNSLSSVLSELETAARLNFGTPTGDKAVKIVSAIKSEIDASSTLQKNTLAKLADVQKEAEALASQLREQAAKVFNLKKDIENYSQVLNEFVKNNFGTSASLEAGKLLAELKEQSTAGASELENMRKKLSTFIENNLEIQQTLARQTSSKVATNKASTNNTSAPISTKNEKPAELSKEQKFINSLAEFQNCKSLDFKSLAERHVNETELQNDATEKKLKGSCVTVCGYISEVDKFDKEEFGYAKYTVQIGDEKSSWQSKLFATGICYARNSLDRDKIESASVESNRCLIGIVRAYGDMVGLQLNKCKVP